MTVFEDLRAVETADVYKGDRLAGSLIRDDADVVFRYAPEYRDDPSTPDLAWTIPKAEADVVGTGGSVPPFFAGLLPEGVRLRGAVTATKTSEDDHLTLLMAVGSDTIGDVRVFPSGAEIPSRTESFNPADRDFDLYEMFDALSGRDSLAIDPTSLPGVQVKVSARMYSTPLATTSGDAILKLAPRENYPRLVQNESFFMSLAAECGLKVANHRVIEDRNGNAGLLVERFDRRAEGHQVERLAQEDGCQVLGAYPSAKYRLKTEDVIIEFGKVSETRGGSARLAALDLLRLVAYSYAIGNGDLHGKNFSVYQAEPGLWAVTPAYDLLCTQPYLGWNDPMALNLYGRANRLRRKDFIESGERLSVPARAVERMLDGVRSGIERGTENLSTIGFDARDTKRLSVMLQERCEELG